MKQSVVIILNTVIDFLPTFKPVKKTTATIAREIGITDSTARSVEHKTLEKIQMRVRASGD